MKTIEIKCKAADLLPIDAILEFQGNLKKISKDNLRKLKTRIIEDGFIVPFFIWEDAGDYKVLDGHQRLAALIALRQEGYDIPLLPVAYIEAKDEAEARRRLLSITSQYGEFEQSVLDEWISTLDKDIAETLRLVDGEIDIQTKLKDFEPVGIEDQGKIDEIEEKLVVCPSCGLEFNASNER